MLYKRPQETAIEHNNYYRLYFSIWWKLETTEIVGDFSGTTVSFSIRMPTFSGAKYTTSHGIGVKIMPSVFPGNPTFDLVYALISKRALRMLVSTVRKMALESERL